ncbi:MAG TPA: methyltransferase domain-containing protein [Aquificaceae bacterium]|nr:methyltransferase domain-containing protein [Aquificaceae bacterium]
MLREGDWVLIRHEDKRYLKKITDKGSINVKKDVLRFSEIIGKPEGIRIGNFEVFKPVLEDIILLGFTRKTQIIYPKDAFYIAFKLGISKDSKILEFGTGSGALCAVLSVLAREVHTYEVVEEFYRLARRNMERFGLGKNVKFFNMDFADARIEPRSFDCAFVDVREPTPYLGKLHECLRDGAPVGFLLPTANQVIELLESFGDRFGAVEVMEIIHRNYKTIPERFRPEDMMVAHTAYLIFARKCTPS